MSGPSVATIKRLFAVSGNRCAFPGCTTPLVDPTSGKVTGRICHIRARNPQGPRHDPDHPDVARDVNNLGSVLCDLGELAGARAAFERALAIDEAVYGPDHPDVARDVNNLGNVLCDLGDLAGARAAFERALRIFEKPLPPDHPNTKTVRKHLESLG